MSQVTVQFIKTEAVLIFVHGATDSRMFSPYIDYIENMFSLVKIDLAGTVIAAGVNKPGGVADFPETMSKARQKLDISS